MAIASSTDLPIGDPDKIPIARDHLIVVASEFPGSVKILRNSIGHRIGLEGVSPLILDWLSRRYKFQYSILEVNVTSLEDRGPKYPGLISYAKRGECDLIISAMGLSFERLRSLELVHPWLHSQIAFLIPYPEYTKNYVSAVVKPFQFWVGVTENIFSYIITTLLNQGGYISCKITPIRLVIGSWCLLTLVLLNVYNGVLISYVTATHREPALINSIEDVAANPNIHIIVIKGQGPDTVISMATTGLYKVLGDKLRAYPMSRCNTIQQCVDLVKSLPHKHVYFSAMPALRTAIENDYQQSRQCKITIAAADTSNSAAGWGLAKNTRHLEKFNRGYSILEANVTSLEDAGPKFPGLISYALRGECDLIMTAMFQTSERLRSLEMVHPWLYMPGAFLIPIPEVIKNNVDAVIKPFQFWVWMGLLVASIAIIITVLGINRILKIKILSIGNQNEETNNQRLQQHQVGVTENIFTYIITTLLNQGGYISCKITPIRLVIGSWCLLTLVLLNVYNGVLISYVTATHREPALINSIDDAASASNIRVLVNKGQGIDMLFSVILIRFIFLIIPVIGLSCTA
ncbi:uncharacterized protein LOC124200584 [Daphnia pulex]|uniref:uncharacterized protein LOC124200584 n=1 Tax=Daphnia pulex TaxID=6669 RepID=UPI001EDDB400|nr:uncharacterized protein LOC124200584 [Daphnia pulex]